MSGDSIKAQTKFINYRLSKRGLIVNERRNKKELRLYVLRKPQNMVHVYE